MHPQRALAVGLGTLAAIAAPCVLGGLERGEAAPRESTIRLERDGHARIPFLQRNQHVWVRGRVNASDSVWIIVDTGASSSVLDDALARQLSLELRDPHEARGAGGLQTGHSVDDVTVHMPGLSIHRRRMDTLDLSALGATGVRPMQVIVGRELFESSVVRFDYAAGVIDVWDAEHAPRDPAGVSLALTFVHRLPYVDGTLVVAGRAPLSGRFVIDSGSSASLLVNPEVVARESLASAFPRTLAVISRGVGGEIVNRVGRGESFALGDLRFEKPIVLMPDSGAGRISAPGTIGNIGGQLLGRCRVTYDYARKRVRFEPAEGFARPFEADMSGATFRKVEGGFEVRRVNPATPAAEAGIEVGDRVTQVDGAPTEPLDPADLRLLLQQDGRVVRMRILRGAESRDVSLTLRRLL